MEIFLEFNPRNFPNRIPTFLSDGGVAQWHHHGPPEWCNQENSRTHRGSPGDGHAYSLAPRETSLQGKLVSVATGWYQMSVQHPNKCVCVCPCFFPGRGVFQHSCVSSRHPRGAEGHVDSWSRYCTVSRLINCSLSLWTFGNSTRREHELLHVCVFLSPLNAPVLRCVEFERNSERPGASSRSWNGEAANHDTGSGRRLAHCGFRQAGRWASAPAEQNQTR